jgi:hypothetical protein
VLAGTSEVIPGKRSRHIRDPGFRYFIASILPLQSLHPGQDFLTGIRLNRMSRSSRNLSQAVIVEIFFACITIMAIY